MPTFTEVTYSGKTAKGNEWIKARDHETGDEITIFGKSVDRAKEAVKKAEAGELVTLPGDLVEYDYNGQKQYKWEHPDDKRPAGGVGGGFRRDPVLELVGIAHHQAMTIVFSHRPPEDVDSLSAFWKKARPHILAMAQEIAEDRQALVKEIKGASV